MRESRLILTVVAALVAAVLGFVVGYKTEPQRQVQIDDAKFRISFGKYLFHLLEAGETNRALSGVRAVLWSDTVAYQRRFGVPSPTDKFERHFAEAQLITTNVESGLRSNAVRFEQEIRSLVKSNDVAPRK